MSRSVHRRVVASMESRAGTKRQWENEECRQVDSKRRGSTLTASLVRQLSPLPPQSGLYAHDGPTPGYPILPPLLTSSYIVSADPITSSSSQCWPPPQALELLHGSKRRSHSLIEVFEHRPRPGTQGFHTGTTVSFRYRLCELGHDYYPCGVRSIPVTEWQLAHPY